MAISLTLLICLSLTFGTACSASPSLDIFVAPSTSFDNTGVLKNTLHTASIFDALHQARLSASSSKSTTIWLLPGIHRLDRPLLLGPEDAHIHFKGVTTTASTKTKNTPLPNKQAIMSGGVSITNWTRITTTAATTATNILQAPWPSSLANNPNYTARQLFVGTNRASLSVDLPSSPLWNLTSNNTQQTSQGYITSSTLPLAWSQKPSYSVEFVWGTEFQQSRCYVVNVSSFGGGGNGSSVFIQLDDPCYSFGSQLGQTGGLPHQIINALVDITLLQQGGWTLSNDNQYVYYNPLDEYEQAQLLNGSLIPIVPALDLLVSIENTPGPNSFTNITFAYAGMNGPERGNGYLERYGGVRYQPCESADAGAMCYNNASMAGAAGCGRQVSSCALAMTPSVVRVLASSSITFTTCTFTHLGGHALGFFNGTTTSGVSASLFDDIAGGAIHIANVNETQFTDPLMQTRGVYVEDSVFTRIGAQYQGAVAVSLFAGVDTVIQHNAVGPVPYTAFSFGWSVPQTSSYSVNNSLLANSVNSPCLWGGDGGPLHTIGPNLGAIMAENYFYNQTRGRAGFYVDNTSNGYYMTRNVIDNPNNSTPFWLFFQQSCDSHNQCGNVGFDNHAWNMWVRNAPDSPFPYDNHNSSVWNITKLNSTSQEFPPEAQQVIDMAGPRKGTQHLRVT